MIIRLKNGPVHRKEKKGRPNRSWNSTKPFLPIPWLKESPAGICLMVSGLMPPPDCSGKTAPPNRLMKSYIDWLKENGGQKKEHCLLTVREGLKLPVSLENTS